MQSQCNEPIATSQQKIRKAHVCVENAALWSEPNVISTPIYTIKRGFAIEIVETFGTYFPFYQIIFQNQRLWISAYNVIMSDHTKGT